MHERGGKGAPLLLLTVIHKDTSGGHGKWCVRV